MILFGSHEFTFLQPESKLIREKCFVGKPILVDFELFHVYIAKSASRECHFDAHLTNITWMPAREPGSGSVDFLAQRIQPARLPVEMGGNKHAELATSNQLGVQSARTGEKKATCKTLLMTRLRGLHMTSSQYQERQQINFHE